MSPTDSESKAPVRPARKPVRHAAALLLGAVTWLAATPAHADADPAVDAFIVDIAKMVDAQEATGWTVDRYELEAVIGDAVHSACFVTEEQRAAALARLDQTLVRLGGPVEQAVESGTPIDELADLVNATRVRDLLAMAVERAPEECSVWIEPDPEFRGVQSDAERFTLNLEGGGVFLWQISGQERNVGAGGNGRLLLLYGFDRYYSVLLGYELGITTLFQDTEVAAKFPVQYTMSAPLVLRRNFLMWHHEVEAAPLVHFTAEDGRPSYGVRVGGLLGVATLRIRHVQPWAGLGLAGDFLFANEARPSIFALRGGLRIGLDWDY